MAETTGQSLQAVAEHWRREAANWKDQLNEALADLAAEQERSRGLDLTDDEMRALIGDWQHFKRWAAYKFELGRALTKLRKALSTTPEPVGEAREDARESIASLRESSERIGELNDEIHGKKGG
jgi:hypothetical protein